MAELIVIGYVDEQTAPRAAEEVVRLARDLVIEPAAVAVISRDREGTSHITTTHRPAAEGATWGMLWGTLLGLLFFIPVFGLAIGGASARPLVPSNGRESTGSFSKRSVTWFSPKPRRTSYVDKVTPNKAIDAPGKCGRVLKTSLPSGAERQLQAV